MVQNSLISVVVPCFNYSHYLPKLFHSLQNQEYNNWECLVIDDDSKDNTKQVVESFLINGIPAQVISPIEFIFNDNFVLVEVNINSDALSELIFAVAELILLLKCIDAPKERADIELTASVLACNAMNEDFNSSLPFQKSSFDESVFSVSP